jgi:hypothetical protein
MSRHEYQDPLFVLIRADRRRRVFLFLGSLVLLAVMISCAIALR